MYEKVGREKLAASLASRSASFFFFAASSAAFFFAAASASASSCCFLASAAAVSAAAFSAAALASASALACCCSACWRIRARSASPAVGALLGLGGGEAGRGERSGRGDRGGLRLVGHQRPDAGKGLGVGEVVHDGIGKRYGDRCLVLRGGHAARTDGRYDTDAEDG